MYDTIREGIDDGTIRNDIDPFLLTMYLMTTLMSVLSLTRPWLYVLDQEGVSQETFAKEFARFISPVCFHRSEARYRIARQR